MTQETTFSNNFIDVTVWRSDTGFYSVETKQWPEGDANAENGNGSFPEPANREFVDFHNDKAAAMRHAENEYDMLTYELNCSRDIMKKGVK